MKKLIIVLCAVIMLTGCSTVEKVADSQAGQLLFNYAVANQLRASSVDPSRVIEAIGRLRQAAGGTETDSIDAVIQELRGELDWEGMYPEDRKLANGIFDIAEQWLRERTDRDGYTVRGSVNDVLDWIEKAAQGMER